MFVLWVVLGIVIVAGCGYAAVCAVAYGFQQLLLYRPPRLPRHLAVPDAVIPAGHQGPALRGWIDNPGHRHALIYLGGSSEPIQLRREALAEAFPHHTRFVIPYRGFGPNRGLAIKEEDLKADTLRVFDWITAELGETLQGIDVLGRSLGTGLALHLAANRPVRRLGLITPYDSILAVARDRYRWLPIGVILRDRFEAWRDAPLIRMPVLAVLAEVDHVTTFLRWEGLRQHLIAPLQEWVAPGTNHSSISESSAMWQTLGQFFGVEPEPTVHEALAPEPIASSAEAIG